MAFATLIIVLASFLVCTFSVPYLLAAPGAAPGVNIGAKLGWIFAVISVTAVVFVVFFVPELCGRSLEETDELFEMRLWASLFRKSETKGIGGRIAQLEKGRVVDAEKIQPPEGVEQVRELSEISNLMETFSWL